MIDSLHDLLHNEYEPRHSWKDATTHDMAAVIVGQLQRIQTLLNRQHAEYPPIAASNTLTANAPLQIYTATRKQYIRLMAVSASAACNITLLFDHPTSGPLKQQAFVAQAAGAGPLPVGEHEFVLPRDARLYVQADQNATIGITASVYEGEEPQLIMNYEF